MEAKNIQGKEVKLAEIQEGDYTLYKSVAIVKKAENCYIVVMAKSQIIRETFETITEAQKYIRNNQIEVAINATLAIMKDVYNLKPQTNNGKEA